MHNNENTLINGRQEETFTSEFVRQRTLNIELTKWIVKKYNPNFFVTVTPPAMGHRSQDDITKAYRTWMCWVKRTLRCNHLIAFIAFERGPLKDIEHAHIVLRVPGRKTNKFAATAEYLFRRVNRIIQQDRYRARRWRMDIQQARSSEDIARYTLKRTTDPRSWEDWEILYITKRSS